METGRSGTDGWIEGGKERRMGGRRDGGKEVEGAEREGARGKEVKWDDTRGERKREGKRMARWVGKKERMVGCWTKRGKKGLGRKASKGRRLN